MFTLIYEYDIMLVAKNLTINNKTMRGVRTILLVSVFLFVAAFSAQAADTFMYQKDTASIKHKWTAINFTEAFAEGVTPAVYAIPQSENGGHDVQVDVRNVSSTGFEMRLEEDKGPNKTWFDGKHYLEDVAWIAFDPNITYTGIEINTVSNNQPNYDYWHTVGFSQTFSATPKVAAFIQTENGSHTVQVDLKDITTTEFKYRLEEDPGFSGNGWDGYHLAEQVTYVAYDPTIGVIDGLLVDEVSIDNSWAQVCYAQDCSEFYNEVPAVYVEIQSENDFDTVQADIKNVTTAGFEVRLEENSKAGWDDAHFAETGAWVSFGEAISEPEPDPDVVAPTSTISLASGDYNTAQTITLAATDNEDPSPAIYYSLNGAAYVQYTASLSLNAEGDYTLNYYSVDASGNSEAVNTATYHLDWTAPTVTADPAAGTYMDSVDVSLSASDGTIYYSTDGSNFDVYSSALTFVTTSTLYFYGVDAMGNQSTTSSETYTIEYTPEPDTTPPTSSITPTGGDYTSAQTLTIAATDNEDPSPTIYYSVNGSGFTEYLAPVELNSEGDYLVEYYASDVSGNNETTDYENYHLDWTAPTVTVDPGTGTYTDYVEVDLSTNDGTIYYSTDGNNYSEYISTLIFTSTTTLYFYGEDGLGNQSAASSETYTIEYSPEPLNVVVVETDSNGFEIIRDYYGVDNDYNVSTLDFDGVRQGIPTGTDLLIFPGGTDILYEIDYSNIFSIKLEQALQDSINTFVQNGGDYIGICSGSIVGADRLYTNFEPWIGFVYYGYVDAADLSPATAVDYLEWYTNYANGGPLSGQSPDTLEFTGHEIAGAYANGFYDVGYYGGPMFEDYGSSDVIAYYTEPLQDPYYAPGSPAILAGDYGAGQYVLSSVHPEFDPNDMFLLNNMIDWVQ